ncbi:NfeD family protein [Naumannella sp. ID2617S]|nr:NfeD family protein [Naumannella sp. ID2617S]
MILLLTLGGVGVALLLVAMLLGDLFDGLFDFDTIGGDFFSLAGLAGFLGALGFGGAIALQLSHSWPVAIGCGVVVGVLVGAGAAWLTARLRDERHNGDVTVRREHLVGSRGRVINEIPAEGFGEVRVVLRGHPTKLNARAHEPVPTGTPVEVVGVLSATSVVVRPDLADPVAE